MAEQGLLDFLAEESGCAYLSELREGTKNKDIKEILVHVHADRFSMKDWQDAAEYLTAEKQQFEDAKKAKAYLLDYFLEKYRE